MSFLDTLDNIRKSSKSTKRLWLALFVTVGMVAAIGIWVLQLKYISQPGKTSGSFQKPFQLILGSIRESWSTFSSSSTYERE